MSSSAGVGGQCNTQTPSVALHLRNLPWECTQIEIFELCKPFGKIMEITSRLGVNRDQAFVYFHDDADISSMISYYASSGEEPKIRGKVVYIQYRNKEEPINKKSIGEIYGNVLLVTIEGVEASYVTVDLIHCIFSPYGYVHKIITFEKVKQYMSRYDSCQDKLPAALIQYTNAHAASTAMEFLNGTIIPSNLFPNGGELCYLNISVSANTDLNINPQSHGSRDYNIQRIPVNNSAVDSTLQSAVGADGKEEEAKGNVLLASVENVLYDITVDVLYPVFSYYGTVQKIAIFVNSGGPQALIQYSDAIMAELAKKTLEGHCIYTDGYCKIHLSYSRHTDICIKQDGAKSRDYTTRAPLQQVPQSAVTSSAVWQGNPGQMYSLGGFSAAPPLCHEMHSSLQTPPEKKQRPTDACFKCGISDHIARNCDQDAEVKAEGPKRYNEEEDKRRPWEGRYDRDMPEGKRHHRNVADDCWKGRSSQER